VNFDLMGNDFVFFSEAGSCPAPTALLVVKNIAFVRFGVALLLASACAIANKIMLAQCHDNIYNQR